MQTVKTKISALVPTRQKTPAAPPALKRIGGVKINEAKPDKKSNDIPVVRVEGDLCKRFNEAKKQMEDAKQVITELQGTVHELALENIFKNNCTPSCLSPITSVKLQDVEGEGEDEQLGEVIRVSFTSRYNACDTDQVASTFDHFEGRDINDYVTETLAAKFDDKVFMDSEGNFNKTVYNKFSAAIEKAAKELGMVDENGKAVSPLTTRRVLTVKPDFHQRRFKDFSAGENMIITQVLPNTIQCVPVRSL